MSFWDIDYDNLVWTNIPLVLRKAIRYAWLKALVAPCKYIKGLFTTFRNNTLYRLSHNGQVCFMTGMLNDTFDPVDRGIYITDGLFVQPIATYLILEEKPVWLGLVSEEGGTTPYPDPAPLYTMSETVTYGYQFIVHVPTAVESLPGYSIEWLRSLVDTYRIPSKSNYNVVYF